MGLRKPSIKKSIAARTTGKFKRQVKKAINPFYGKKGAGWVRNPKKALYNKVYNKTTVGVSDLIKPSRSHRKNAEPEWVPSTTSPATYKVCGVLMKGIAVCTGVVVGLPCLFSGMFFVALLAFAATFGLWKLGSAWSKRAAGDIEEAPEDLPLEADDLSDE